MPPATNHPGRSQTDLRRGIALCAGASITALQPPRLLLGTMAVALIALVGSLLDTVGPLNHLGALDQPATQERIQEVQASLATLATELDVAPVPVEDNEQTTFDPETVRSALIEAWHTERATLDGDNEALEALNAHVRNSLATINAAQPNGTFKAASLSAGASLEAFVRSVLAMQPGEAFAALGALLYDVPTRAWHASPLMTVLIGLLLAFALALFGGAIARLDALDTGMRRKPRAWSGLEYAWANIGSFLRVLLFPLALVGILGGVSALLGVPFNLPVLDVLGGVFYVVAVIAGVLASIVLLGYVLVLPFLIGAIAAEHADPSEVIQRAWEALLRKPLQLAVCLMSGAICAALVLAAVDGIVVLALEFAATSWGGIIHGDGLQDAGSLEWLDLQFQSTPALTSGTAGAAGALIGFWESLLVALLLGYIFSWIASFSTRLFLVMRLLIDRQSVSVIWAPGVVPGTTVKIGTTPQSAFKAEDSFTDGER